MEEARRRVLVGGRRCTLAEVAKVAVLRFGVDLSLPERPKVTTFACFFPVEKAWALSWGLVLVVHVAWQEEEAGSKAADGQLVTSFDGNRCVMQRSVELR
jgi:hypothetical protein